MTKVEENVLKLIQLIRESFPESVDVYANRKSYQFYEIIKFVFTDAAPYYAKGQVWIKIDNDFYGILGKQDLSNFRTYKLD